MKAIVTKYVPPTDTKGSRISARAEGVRAVTVAYDHNLDTYDAHKKAALKLCSTMKWKGCNRLQGGTVKNGDIVFVFCNGK